MNILVCVKRVPATGGRIEPDRRRARRSTPASWASWSARTRNARSRRRSRSSRPNGGSRVVMTLGPDAAEDQLRDAMAIGVDRAVLLETDGADWDRSATAAAIADAIRAHGGRRRTVRPDPVRQRGGRRRRVPGRDPGRHGARPADRHRGARHSRSPTGWRSSGARAPPAGRSSSAAARRRRGPRGDQPAALPVGAGPPAGQEEGDRPHRPDAQRRAARRRSACGSRPSRRTRSRSSAPAPRLRPPSSRCSSGWGLVAR